MLAAAFKWIRALFEAAGAVSLLITCGAAAVIGGWTASLLDMPVPLQVIAAIGLAAVLSGCGLAAQRAYARRGPLIVAGDIDDKFLTGGGPNRMDGLERHAMVKLYGIPFENVVESGSPTAVATDVYADVRLLDGDGTELDRAHGRWRELADVPLDTETVRVGQEVARPIVLAPNGQRHMLDVLAQDYTYLPRAKQSLGCWLVRDPFDAAWFKSKHKLPPGSRAVLMVTVHGNGIRGGKRLVYDIEVPLDPDHGGQPEEPVKFKRKGR